MFKQEAPLRSRVSKKGVTAADEKCKNNQKRAQRT